jgi:nucleotide-binding universal stress UspA family protein
MPWDPKVLKVARILLRKHGTDALGVAQKRADEWSERGAERAANLWRVIGSAAMAMLNRARRRTGRRASLPEVLHGSVTQKVMDADKVERHHVARLMRQTKRRRASNDL